MKVPKFHRLQKSAETLVPVEQPPAPMRQGWELIQHIAEQYATLASQERTLFQFRMSRATWDELMRINNLHGSDPVFGDSCFGIPVRVWPHVPDGEVWRVSREVLKDLGEAS